MASTATRFSNSPNLSGMSSQLYDIDLAGGDTSIAIKTGLNRVYAAFFANSVSAVAPIINVNFSDAGTTAAAGTVFISGLTANDNGKLLVLGN